MKKQAYVVHIAVLDHLHRLRYTNFYEFVGSSSALIKQVYKDVVTSRPEYSSVTWLGCGTDEHTYIKPVKISYVLPRSPKEVREELTQHLEECKEYIDIQVYRKRCESYVYIRRVE